MLLAMVIAGVVRLNPPIWAKVAGTLAVLIGIGFSVVAVWVVPLLRERRLVRKLAAAFAAKRITRGDHNPMVGDFDGVAISVFVKIGEDSSVPAGK